MAMQGRVEDRMTGRAYKARDMLRGVAARLTGPSQPIEPPRRGTAALLRIGGPSRTFLLEGPGPWWVGRGPRAQVRLDDDPFVSRRHLCLRRHGEAFTVEAARRAVNAASVDLAALPPGVPVLLAPGAVLVAGQSRLVFKSPAPPSASRRLP